jgi:hypothetical protein
MHDVFISHATEDEAVAADVCALLEGRGIQCWIAPRDVAPGKVWDEAILDAIESSGAFLLILSAAANASSFVKNEVNRAFGARKTIFTFRVKYVLLWKSLGACRTPHSASACLESPHGTLWKRAAANQKANELLNTWRHQAARQEGAINENRPKIEQGGTSHDQVTLAESNPPFRTRL